MITSDWTAPVTIVEANWGSSRFACTHGWLRDAFVRLWSRCVLSIHGFVDTAISSSVNSFRIHCWSCLLELIKTLLKWDKNLFTTFRVTSRLAGLRITYPSPRSKQLYGSINVPFRQYITFQGAFKGAQFSIMIPQIRRVCNCVVNATLYRPEPLLCWIGSLENRSV